MRSKKVLHLFIGDGEATHSVSTKRGIWKTDTLPREVQIVYYYKVMETSFTLFNVLIKVKYYTRFK